MKGWLILFVLLSLGSPPFANGQQDRFESANQLLENHRVTEAMEIYRDIEQEGYRSGMLFYNMGIASLYQDSLGLAKYYFMRSALYEDANPEAEQALRHVNNQFDRRSAILPSLPWERFFDALSERVGYPLLMILSIVLLHIAAGLLILSWARPRIRRYLHWPALFVCLIACLSLFSALWIETQQNRYQTGVLIESSTSLRQSADHQSGSVITVYEGFTMRVDLRKESSNSDWLYVRLQNGMSGWINRNSVQAF